MDEKLAKSLGRIESKIDGLHEDIVELKEADTNLHERISVKDKDLRRQVGSIDSRVTKLESGLSAIKWLLSGLGVIGTAIATFFAGRN